MDFRGASTAWWLAKKGTRPGLRGEAQMIAAWRSCGPLPQRFPHAGEAPRRGLEARRNRAEKAGPLSPMRSNRETLHETQALMLRRVRRTRLEARGRAARRASFETQASPALFSRPLPLRSLCEPLRSQWNFGLPSAQDEDEAFEPAQKNRTGKSLNLSQFSACSKSRFCTYPHAANVCLRQGPGAIASL